MRSITLVPYGGLANRMRAIGSLIQLMGDADADAEFIWFKDQGLNCRFDELFDPIAIPRLSIKEARLSDLILRDRPRKKNFFVPAFFERLLFDSCLHEDVVTHHSHSGFDFKKWVLSHRKSYLSACVNFYENHISSDVFSVFRPIAFVQSQIAKLTEQFSPHTIGVHIRRTDHIRCIDASPTERYIEMMRAEIAKDPDVCFYLATDSMDEKKELCGLFGKRIITHFNPVSRNTLEGMQEALIELYALSETNKIFGSSFSSYSLTAAEISGIEHIDVTIR